MSFTRKSHIIYILGVSVFFSIFAAATAVMAGDASTDTITGRITAINAEQQTITLKTKDFGGEVRDVVIRAAQTTNLAECGLGAHGEISKLKVGDRIIVSYYNVNNQLHALSISPRGTLSKC